MPEFVGDMHDFVDGQGTVIRPAPCRNCSYKLLGLNQAGRCPRCGAPIAVSVCGNYLRFAHPHWLSEVASGITLMLWGMLIGFGLSAIASFMFASDPAMKQFLAMAGSALSLYGAWMMTRPDPSGIGETRNLNARQVVRAAAIASLGGAVIQFVLTLPGVSLGSLGELAVVAALCGLATIVGEFAKLQYLQQLASRLPEENLVWRAGGLKWALAITYGLLIAAGLVAAAAAFSLDFSGSPHLGNFGGSIGVAAAIAFLVIPAGIALLVITVMIIDLFYRTSQAIRAQIPLAKDAWRRSVQTGQVTAPPAPPGPSGPVTTAAGPAAAGYLQADEPFLPPFAAAWTGAVKEAAPVAPLKVAHLAAEEPAASEPATELDERRLKNTAGSVARVVAPPGD